MILAFDQRHCSARLNDIDGTQGLYSLSGKTSYRQISRSRNPEIRCYDDRIALEVDRHLGSVAAEVPVKLQIGLKRLNSNLSTWRLHEILR